ncbi:MAG: alpha amylase C-terminal domain-containing protein [Planctomycetota bacterium]
MTKAATEAADREALKRRLVLDPLLEPYADVLARRVARAREMERRLTAGRMDLATFASGHEYFGLHFRDGRWVAREWAPNAAAIHLKGPFTDWKARAEFAFARAGTNGVWELALDAGKLAHGDLYRLEVRWPGGGGDRFPAWGRRVVQDPRTEIFNPQVWRPPAPYEWRYPAPPPVDGPLLVYETHIGMAQDAARVGTYDEFRRNVLPRIRDAGYTALQIMALAEHPYYASFGYQVTSFFACSSRFGTPEELKALVDEAHGMGLRVLMDLVHSHASRNEVEGLSRLNGSPSLYFHAGPRGDHPGWDSRCFDYGKPEVLHFLLSNCRFWLDEFHMDGFRFDGVTSMLYHHHGLSHAFTHYDEYFGGEVDEDALAYLTLANRVVHSVAPHAVTVAEDVSGLPGLALPVEEGGAGFDYRFAMGVPDLWIELTKDTPDERWNLGRLWHELTNRRRDEKAIGYCESHDQALVGDQTLIFRLVGARMYDRMAADSKDLVVDRGIALHKMIRLVTLAAAGHGYLNFMGNEFGHPEWIDFPRPGNGWSYTYARRQWHLADDEHLRYRHLAAFDRDLIALARRHALPNGQEDFLLHRDEGTKVLAFLRAGLVFVFNFHPDRSFPGYWIPAAPGEYRVVLDTDRPAYGGFARQDPAVRHRTVTDPIERHHLSLYLPARTALVLEKTDGRR